MNDLAGSDSVVNGRGDTASQGKMEQFEERKLNVSEDRPMEHDEQIIKDISELMNDCLRQVCMECQINESQQSKMTIGSSSEKCDAAENIENTTAVQESKLEIVTEMLNSDEDREELIKFVQRCVSDLVFGALEICPREERSKECGNERNEVEGGIVLKCDTEDSEQPLTRRFPSDRNLPDSCPSSVERFLANVERDAICVLEGANDAEYSDNTPPESKHGPLKYTNQKRVCESTEADVDGSKLKKDNNVMTSCENECANMMKCDNSNSTLEIEPNISEPIPVDKKDETDTQICTKEKEDVKVSGHDKSFSQEEKIETAADENSSQDENDISCAQVSNSNPELECNEVDFKLCDLMGLSAQRVLSSSLPSLNDPAPTKEKPSVHFASPLVECKEYIVSDASQSTQDLNSQEREHLLTELGVSDNVQVTTVKPCGLFRAQAFVARTREMLQNIGDAPLDVNESEAKELEVKMNGLQEGSGSKELEDAGGRMNLSPEDNESKASEVAEVRMNVSPVEGETKEITEEHMDAVQERIRASQDISQDTIDSTQQSSCPMSTFEIPGSGSPEPPDAFQQEMIQPQCTLTAQDVAAMKLDEVSTTPLTAATEPLPQIADVIQSSPGASQMTSQKQREETSGYLQCLVMPAAALCEIQELTQSGSETCKIEEPFEKVHVCISQEDFIEFRPASQLLNTQDSNGSPIIPVISTVSSCSVVQNEKYDADENHATACCEKSVVEEVEGDGDVHCVPGMVCHASSNHVIPETKSVVCEGGPEVNCATPKQSSSTENAENEGVNSSDCPVDVDGGNSLCEIAPKESPKCAEVPELGVSDACEEIPKVNSQEGGRIQNLCSPVYEDGPEARVEVNNSPRTGAHIPGKCDVHPQENLQTCEVLLKIDSSQECIPISKVNSEPGVNLNSKCSDLSNMASPVSKDGPMNRSPECVIVPEDQQKVTASSICDVQDHLEENSSIMPEETCIFKLIREKETEVYSLPECKTDPGVPLVDETDPKLEAQKTTKSQEFMFTAPLLDPNYPLKSGLAIDDILDEDDELDFFTTQPFSLGYKGSQPLSTQPFHADFTQLAQVYKEPRKECPSENNDNVTCKSPPRKMAKVGSGLSCLKRKHSAISPSKDQQVPKASTPKKLKVIEEEEEGIEKTSREARVPSPMFKWRYVPSVEEDDMQILPQDDEVSDDSSLRLPSPLKTPSKARRVGLSRRHRGPSLHPSLHRHVRALDN